MTAILKTNSKNRKFESITQFTRKYTVRLARNQAEIEEALKLRFQVFNIELGEGLASSYTNNMDVDEFDAQCDHLIVVENETAEVIGTYRLQDNNMAEQAMGFYTMREFQINLLPSEILLNAVEAGRACIRKDHRNSRTLYLLWKGIAKYLSYSGRRHLFGCCSIPSQDDYEGWQYYRYLNKHDFVDTNMLIPVQPDYICKDKIYIKKSDPILPNLFTLYLKLGAKVCSVPAIDQEFKTIDFLILLDLQNLSTETKQLFFT
ncbi:GNAT family N-acetyltransferase [Gracilimonas sp.]|uniref:GNAT family N-acetyltransferase n=1 Tax=Gracilimonas sp. TaxID=1974203 RepID=UPI002870FFF7|nr:GNAT family N-acyltransferase [Gracilimonas sp.]